MPSFLNIFYFSLDIEFQTPILDVLYNAAHKDFTARRIMVRGTVVEVDGEPFKNWYGKLNFFAYLASFRLLEQPLYVV